MSTVRTDEGTITVTNLAYATAAQLNEIVAEVHARNETWWYDPATDEPLKRNIGEMLMLVVSELSEAMEGHRKNLQDDHLLDRSMFEVELADAVIRICDIAGGCQLDIGSAIVEKLAYNAHRADHKPAARLAPGGKAY